jgi:hypothetical protein
MSKRKRRMQEKRRRHTDRGRLPSRRQLVTGTGVTVGATLMLGSAAQAATFTVDSLADPADSGHTTLRDALTSAELPANAGSTITFASGLSGTITLGSELPVITQATTIQGPGAGQLAISGNDATRIMHIEGPTDGFPVSISGLTLRNGLAQSPPGPRNGGAIFITNADLTVADSILSGNRALGSTPTDGYGGGICICYDIGSLTVRNSTFSGNLAGGSGGAIYDDNSPVTISGSTFSGNQAYFRGGVASISSTSPPGVAIRNSTFTGNKQTATGGSDYGGGAIFSYEPVTITSSTVAGNSGSRGGGVALDSSVPPPDVLHNTIVANNTASEAGPDLLGAFDSAFSLVRDTTGASINQTLPGSNVFGADPQLTGLASNGGPTQTMKPALTSPAIDKGAAFGLTSDQRGSARPIEIPSIPNSTAAGADGSDIGAYELPSNDFKIKKVKGRKLVLKLASAGDVQVTGAKGKKRSADATASKSKKLLKTSKASGGPGKIKVALKLTKSAAKRLARTGKLKLKAMVTFSPADGWPATKTAKLKLKTKK